MRAEHHGSYRHVCLNLILNLLFLSKSINFYGLLQKKKLNKRARSAVAFGRTAAFDYNDD